MRHRTLLQGGEKIAIERPAVRKPGSSVPRTALGRPPERCLPCKGGVRGGSLVCARRPTRPTGPPPLLVPEAAWIIVKQPGRNPLPSQPSSQRNLPKMHHRRTDFGRRATLRGGDRAALRHAGGVAAGPGLALGRRTGRGREGARRPTRHRGGVGAARSRAAPAGPPAARSLLRQVPLQRGAGGGRRLAAVHLDGRGPSRGLDLAEGRRRARQGGDAAAGGPPAEARGSPGAARLGRPLPRLRGPRRAPATRAGSIMRRLSNVEYTRTIRDLTGVPLDPAREFPQDGAAGEGFTNTGDALVMSPALLGKYLDAAKEVAAHAVPLPDGFRFSRAASRRDWTDELIADIRRLYDRFADKDGKIPLEAVSRRDDRAAQHDRRAGRSRTAEIRALADAPRPEPEVPRDALGDARRARIAVVDRRAARRHPLAMAGRRAGRCRGPGRRDPAVAGGAVAVQQRRLRLRRHLAGARHRDGRRADLAAQAAGIHPERRGRALPVGRRCRRRARGRRRRLAAAAAGDAGPAALLLRDVRDLTPIPGRPPPRGPRRRPASTSPPRPRRPPGCDRAKIAALARAHDVPADALAAWLDYLGLAGEAPVRIEGYLTEKDARGGGYEYVKAWRSGELPNLVANSSDKEVNIPGRLRPHGIVVHPSPEPLGGDRLAQPDRRPGARRRDGRRRARRLRQRRRLVAGAAPRRPAPPARGRRLRRRPEGDDRADRRPGRAGRRPDLAGRRPARRQPRLRH